MPQASAVEINSPQPLGAPAVAVDPLVLGSSTLSASVATGASSITLAASITGLGLGSPLVITDGANTETVFVLSASSAPTYTLASPTLYAHALGVAVSLTVNVQAIGIIDPANPSRRATLDANNSLQVVPGPSSSLGVNTIASANAVANVALNAASSSASGTQPAGSTAVVNMNGASTATLVVQGTFVLSGIVEKTYDGTNWMNAVWTQDNVVPAGIGSGGYGPNSIQPIQIFAPNALQVRFRVTSYTSGTGNAYLAPTPFSPYIPNPQTIVSSASGYTGTQTGTVAAGNATAGPFSQTLSSGFSASAVSYFFNASAATTLYVMVSPDNTNFFLGATQTLSAAGTGVISLPASRYIKTASSAGITLIHAVQAKY